VKYESSPFPLDSKFEYEIFSALPMTDEELAQTEMKYKGRYNYWTGALQHISVWSTQDTSHAVMGLSG